MKRLHSTQTIVSVKMREQSSCVGPYFKSKIYWNLFINYFSKFAINNRILVKILVKEKVNVGYLNNFTSFLTTKTKLSSFFVKTLRKYVRNDAHSNENSTIYNNKINLTDQMKSFIFTFYIECIKCRLTWNFCTRQRE